MLNRPATTNMHKPEAHCVQGRRIAGVKPEDMAGGSEG